MVAGGNYLQGTVAAVKSAEVDGAAAAMGKHNKEEENRRDVDGRAYEWEPVLMESGGRVGRGAMCVIERLAKIAAESDGVEKHFFCAAHARGAELGENAGGGGGGEVDLEMKILQGTFPRDETLVLQLHFGTAACTPSLNVNA